MKINLIFFCANFTRGGAGNSIIRLCKKLNKKKYQISIICLNKFSYFKENKNAKIKWSAHSKHRSNVCPG